MSGDIFGHAGWGVVPLASSSEGQDAAKPPAGPKTDPQHRRTQPQMLLALRLETAPAFLEVSLALTLKSQGLRVPSWLSGLRIHIVSAMVLVTDVAQFQSLPWELLHVVGMAK